MSEYAKDKYSISWILADEGLYAQPDIRGMTLKREFRDELGYIAPPNRKLPPVPGSNYNTCDRLKRGKSTRIFIAMLLSQRVLRSNISLQS
jgi:hypothetical protein